MRTHRFGQKLKLPSTRAIKHQIMTLLLQDYRRAQLLAPMSPDGDEIEQPPQRGSALVAPTPTGSTDEIER